MNSSHLVRVLGRELHLKSTTPAETVREIERFVNEKLKEVAATVNTNDPQIIAILALMNISELYLALSRENDACRQQGSERLSRILYELEKNLE